MHVMVVLRLVPDTGEDFELAADGKGIDREWIGFKLNEFDDHALEQAVLLKESHGAKVTAVALQHEGVDRLLQTALARGADNVVKISNTLLPPVPAMAAAQLVAAAARSLECSLILTGVQTVEDLFGQLAPTLGAVLDWPQVSAISGVKLEGERACCAARIQRWVCRNTCPSTPCSPWYPGVISAAALRIGQQTSRSHVYQDRQSHRRYGCHNNGH